MDVISMKLCTQMGRSAGGSFYRGKRSRDGCDWFREIKPFECIGKSSLKGRVLAKRLIRVMESNVSMKQRVFEDV